MMLCSLLLPLHSLSHSSLSIRISQRHLCRFLFHSISFTGCIAPVVAFALSAPFLSFQQHISTTSLSIFVSFHQFHWLLCPLLLPLRSLPHSSLFIGTSHCDFFAAFHFINVTGCFTPYCCLCALCSIPLFLAAYLQDFSDNFRFIQSMSLAALPLLFVARNTDKRGRKVYGRFQLSSTRRRNVRCLV